MVKKEFIMAFSLLVFNLSAQSQTKSLFLTSRYLYNNGFSHQFGIALDRKSNQHSFMLGFDKILTYNDRVNPALGYNFMYLFENNFLFESGIHIRFGQLRNGLAFNGPSGDFCSGKVSFEEYAGIGYRTPKIFSNKITIKPSIRFSLLHGYKTEYKDTNGVIFPCHISVFPVLSYPSITFSYHF